MYTFLIHSHREIHITDSHDYIVRFNNAPTAGYEEDVGSKTSLRILNSQILSKAHFNFANSSLYQNVSLLVWDPSKHSNSTLSEVRIGPRHFQLIATWRYN